MYDTLIIKLDVKPNQNTFAKKMFDQSDITMWCSNTKWGITNPVLTVNITTCMEMKGLHVFKETVIPWQVFWYGTNFTGQWPASNRMSIAPNRLFLLLESANVTRCNGLSAHFVLVWMSAPTKTQKFNHMI